jgi:hypothetical protein
MKRTRYAAAAFLLAVLPGSYLALAQQPASTAPAHAMTFFVTSVGMGKEQISGDWPELTPTVRRSPPLWEREITSGTLT